MLPLLLLLLLTPVAFGEPEAKPTMITKPACDSSMKCVIPMNCFTSRSSTDLTLMVPEMQIEADCTAIVQFRVYSNQKWSMVLESLDQSVNKLSFEHGDTKFECSIVDSKVKATYNKGGAEEEMETANSSVSPLLCKFMVQRTAPEEVFADATTKVMLTVNGNAKYRIDADMFKLYKKPTCDPENAKAQAIGEDGDKMTTQVEEKVNSMDLICPDGYDMTYRDEGQFRAASSIVCTNEHGNFEYAVSRESQPDKFFIAPFEARCERPKCLMCPDTPPKSDCAQASKYKVEMVQGCKKISCINGRIQLGKVKKTYENAECSYIDGKHVYAIENEVISGDSDADCIEALECDEKLSEKACPDCVLDKKNQPKCQSGNNLTYTNGKHSREVIITCDGLDGILYIAGKTSTERRKLKATDELSCTMPAQNKKLRPPPEEKNVTYSQAQLNEFAEEAKSPWRIGVWILLGINCILLVLVCMAAAHFQEELAAQKNKAVRKMRKKVAEKLEKLEALEPKDLSVDDSRYSKIEEPSVPSEFNRPLNPPLGKPVNPMDNPELKAKTEAKQVAGVGAVSKKE